VAMFEDFIPESDEVRAEKRKRFDIVSDFAHWFKDLDTQEAIKFYFAGLLIVMILSTLGGGFKTIVEWSIKSTKEDKHA
jgi:hypothetical protein